MSRKPIQDEDKKESSKIKDKLGSRQKTPHPNKLEKGKKHFIFFTKADQQLVKEQPKKAAPGSDSSDEVKNSSKDTPAA